MKLRHYLGLLLLVLAWACPLLAQEKQEESPWAFTKGINKVRPAAITYTLHDEVKPAKSLKSIDSASVRRVVLGNGLRILVQEVPYDDVVAIETLVKCGVFQEESNLAGYTNFVLELLLNRITTDKGEDIAEVTGSVVDVGLTPDLARISIVTSSKYRDYMLDRLGAAFSSTQFSEAEVEAVRPKLLTVLKERGGGFGQLYEIFLGQFYRYHPYKRSSYGSEAVVKKATPEALSEFFRRHFAADRMVISVSGRVDYQPVVQKLKHYMSHLQPNPEEIISVQWEPQAQDKETYLSSSSSVAWVLVGYPAPPMLSSDYAAMRLVCGALGTGLSSRLWTELREKRGLAYELSGRYPDLCGPSHFLCYAVCKATSAGEVRRRIMGEVDRFKKEGITPQELEDTRNKLIGDYLIARETNAGKALNLGTAELLGPGYFADAQYLRDLEQVTASQVNQAAKKYLNEPCLLVARPGGRFYLDW